MTIEEIKSYMKKNKITYQMLADMAGLSISTVTKIFGGFAKYPRVDTMQAIEKALGLSTSSMPASTKNAPPTAFENMPELLFEKRFLDIAKIYHELTDEYREKILTVVTVIALSVGLDIEQILNQI